MCLQFHVLQRGGAAAVVLSGSGYDGRHRICAAVLPVKSTNLSSVWKCFVLRFAFVALNPARSTLALAGDQDVACCTLQEGDEGWCQYLQTTAEELSANFVLK
jgi:hypothetical protein